MNNTDEKKLEAGVLPFRPYIYDVRSAGDIKNLTAPPYDVISKELQDDLYGRSEYNIVRLEFGKEEGDGGAENKYKRAARLFNEWISKGILKRVDKDSIYIYVQKFTAGIFILEHGKDRAEVGVSGFHKLEPVFLRFRKRGFVAVNRPVLFCFRQAEKG